MIHDAYLQFAKQLRQLDTWLQKAEALAKEKSFDASVLVGARLAPDQFPLSFQVQTACDTAKLTAARFTGKTPPSNADTEQTIEELRARVASTLTFLDSLTKGDFNGWNERTIANPRWEGKTMNGHDYFFEHAMPNFYFHLAHVYALLRHNGVSIGKKDYLGALSLR